MIKILSWFRPKPAPAPVKHYDEKVGCRYIEMTGKCARCARQITTRNFRVRAARNGATAAEFHCPVCHDLVEIYMEVESMDFPIIL